MHDLPTIFDKLATRIADKAKDPTYHLAHSQISRDTLNDVANAVRSLANELRAEQNARQAELDRHPPYSVDAEANCVHCGRPIRLISVKWNGHPQSFWRHIGNRFTGKSRRHTPSPGIV